MTYDVITALEFTPRPEHLYPAGWRQALEAEGCTVARRDRSCGAAEFLVVRGPARIRFRVFAEHTPRQALLSAGFLSRQLLWLLQRNGLVRVHPKSRRGDWDGDMTPASRRGRARPGALLSARG